MQRVSSIILCLVLLMLLLLLPPLLCFFVSLSLEPECVTFLLLSLFFSLQIKPIWIYT